MRRPHARGGEKGGQKRGQATFSRKSSLTPFFSPVRRVARGFALDHATQERWSARSVNTLQAKIIQPDHVPLDRLLVGAGDLDRQHVVALFQREHA